MSEFNSTSDRQGSFVLRLYVAGRTPESLRALANARRICEVLLGGKYRLEVIDIFNAPDLTNEEIFAAPALVKTLPGALRMVLGDLSDHQKVLVGLGIDSEEQETE